MMDASDTAPPLRIALISYYLPSTSKIGVGYQVHELACALHRRGHDVTVISASPPVAHAPYAHRLLAREGRWRTFGFALDVRRTDLSDMDVIHAHGDDYWLWRRRAPVHIRTVHGSCFEEALRIRGAKERVRMVALGFSEVMASLVADRTVVVSPRTRRWVPRVHAVIPNGVDTARFRPRPGGRAERPTVLFVGTWRQRKRGEALAHVFTREVLPQVPDAELRMVCRDAPADAGEAITVLGAVSDAELEREYARAWVFCLPSAYEGFGIPYAEAMASGLPVVATPNVGARYVLDEGRAGVLTELDGLGDHLVSLLTDADRRVAMARAGSARVAEFDLDTVVDRYEQLYRGAASA